jgi:hypothetical protein
MSEESTQVTTTTADGRKPGEECLTVSPGVPGQEWCVLSFVTPGDTATKFRMYEYDHFLAETINEYIVSSTRDMCRRINANFFKEVEDKIATLEKSKNENHILIAREMHDIRKKLETNEEEFAKLCTHTHGMNLDDSVAKFEDFQIRRGDKLREEFEKENGKRPTVTGIKFDGAYPFMEQAEERAKFLAENVERGVHHFIAQSFHWCPFDPNADAIKEQRYQNQELNRLMEEQRRNQEQQDRVFNKRTEDLKTQAQSQNQDLKARLRKKYKNRKGGDSKK